MSIIERYVVIVTGADGTQSVTGPFSSEYRATLWANKNETMESGLVCQVTPLESPLCITR